MVPWLMRCISKPGFESDSHSFESLVASGEALYNVSVHWAFTTRECVALEVLIVVLLCLCLLVEYGELYLTRVIMFN